MRRSNLILLILLMFIIIFICRAQSNQTANHSINYTDIYQRIPDEQKVFGMILQDYKSSARPISEKDNQIQISFRVKLNQIIDMEEKPQILITSLFLEHIWFDHYLQWNTSRYSGVRTLRISADKVWLPDTYVFNNADEDSSGFLKAIYVLVKNTGEVTWPVPTKLKTRCKIDITFFPFDIQTCKIRFGSWSYRYSRLQYLLMEPYKKSNISSSVDLTEYVDSSDWDLMSVHLENLTRPPGIKLITEPQIDLVMTLKLRRRSFYYLWNIITPCIMLTVLALLMFWTPVQTGEKISLGLSVFLALYMFMLQIAHRVPPTSESIPLIGLYLVMVMGMTATSVVMNVIVVNLHTRGEKYRRAPVWVRKVFLNNIAKFLRIKHDIYAAAQKTKLVKAHKPGDEGQKSRIDIHIKAIRRWHRLLIMFYRSCFLNNMSESENKLPSQGHGMAEDSFPKTSSSYSVISNLNKQRKISTGGRCSCCLPEQDVWSERLPPNCDTSFIHRRGSQGTTFANITAMHSQNCVLRDTSTNSFQSQTVDNCQDNKTASLHASPVKSANKLKRIHSSGTVLGHNPPPPTTTPSASFNCDSPLIKPSSVWVLRNSEKDEASQLPDEYCNTPSCADSSNLLISDVTKSARPGGTKPENNSSLSTDGSQNRRGNFVSWRKNRQQPNRSEMTSRPSKSAACKKRIDRSSGKQQSLISRLRQSRNSVHLRRITLASGVDEHLLIMIEWQILSQVVDKCMFAVCFIATIIIYCILFLSPRYAIDKSGDSVSVSLKP